MLFFQFKYAITSACLANPSSTMGYCWGPEGVEFLSLNFNIGYIYQNLILLAISFGISSLGVFIRKNKENLFDFGFKIFSIIYIIGALLILLINRSVMY